MALEEDISVGGAATTVTRTTPFIPVLPGAERRNVEEDIERIEDGDQHKPEEVVVEVKAYVPRYIDVGINLADEVYSGVYHGRKV